MHYKILAGITVIFCLMPFMYSFDAQGIQNNNIALSGNAHISPVRRVKSYSLEEKKTILVKKYELADDEVDKLLRLDMPFREVDRLCFYAYISQKSIDEVAALKKDCPWDRVVYLLNITPQEYHDRRLKLRAHWIHEWWEFDENQSYEAMNHGYPMHYVKIAWILSVHTGKDMRFFLKDRKASEPWPRYCMRTLGITEETYNSWIDEYQNPTYFPGKR